MAADYSSNHDSLPSPSQSSRAPELSGDVGVVANSAKLRVGKLFSPWAQVVRGESESTTAVHHSPASSSSSLSSLVILAPEVTPLENCSASKVVSSAVPSSLPPSNSVVDEISNANNGITSSPKKPVWNRLSNGVVEVGNVMGADSWPALSESTTRASPKPSVESSSKPTIDGYISNSQGPVPTNSPMKQAFTNANSNATPNYTFPARQRHLRNGGSSSGTSHSTFPRHSPSPSPSPPPPPPPLHPIYQMPPPNFYGNLIPQIPEPSPRGPFRSNHWEARPVGGFLSQPRGMHDHRNSSRRGNHGPYHQGDGAYPNSHGARHDQDRGGHGNARMQPQRAPPRGFVRPLPPHTTAFIHPPPMRPFLPQLGYQEFMYVPTLPSQPIRGVMPFISHAPTPAMPIPIAEPSLPTLIVNQIDYYFSDANLIKDEFLRSNMDDQGWVPISLIASFPRVKNLTDNIQVILSSLSASSVVEVQDDKIRRRTEWMKWLPTFLGRTIESGSFSRVDSNHDHISASLEKITVEEPAAGHNRFASKTDAKLEVGSENYSIEPTTES